MTESRLSEIVIVIAIPGWDLEYNKVIRHYHGHLSGVYCLSLHPTLDVLITGGRGEALFLCKEAGDFELDSVARVWDMRTKHQVHILAGHNSTVGSLLTSSVDPQVITGSYDSTIKVPWSQDDCVVECFNCDACGISCGTWQRAGR